jgi:DNA-binding response OmpR family regulator
MPIERNVGATGSIVHHILIVDDDSATTATIKQLLEKNGYTVQIAKDGGQAHSAFGRLRPDFVLLDIILPGETGFEVCERMKQHDETVPIMMVTGIDMDDSRNLAARVGADGYLTKPFHPDTLLERIIETAERVWQKSHTTQPKQEKRIRFNCRCGKRFKVSPTHRGRTLTCPDCGEPLVVPFHD